MASKTATTGTLSTTGEGRVQVKPTLVRIHLSVITEAKTAEEAMRDNAARTTPVIERLRELGLRSNDIQTLGITVYPQMSYDEGSDQGRITGYRAENTIAVETKVGLAGEVIDEATAAGVNQISSLSFGLKDEGPSRDKALKAAVKAAQADAEVVARATSVKLLAPTSVEILGEERPRLMRELSRGTGHVTPIAPGELSVTARVRLVFATRAG